MSLKVFEDHEYLVPHFMAVHPKLIEMFQRDESNSPSKARWKKKKIWCVIITGPKKKKKRLKQRKHVCVVKLSTIKAKNIQTKVKQAECWLLFLSHTDALRGSILLHNTFTFCFDLTNLMDPRKCVAFKCRPRVFELSLHTLQTSTTTTQQHNILAVESDDEEKIQSRFLSHDAAHASSLELCMFMKYKTNKITGLPHVKTQFLCGSTESVLRNKAAPSTKETSVQGWKVLLSVELLK